MESELKPCPFCEGSPVRQENNGSYRVMCIHCCAATCWTLIDKQGAVDDWNRRPIAASPRWHKRPTGPGLWVCELKYRVPQYVVEEIGDELAVPFGAVQVFGPIPEPPKDVA